MTSKNRNGPTRRANALSELVVSVFRVHGALIAMGDELVSALGLSSARWQVLGAIALAGEPLTVPAIARSMGLTRQGVQKQVDLLLGAELVRLQDNPAHRGSPLVTLTDAGRTTYDRADARWTARADELAEALSLSDIAAARKVIEALHGRLCEAREDD
jgi:DNA-binding MarR family transcriptional regulator